MFNFVFLGLLVKADFHVATCLLYFFLCTDWFMFSVFFGGPNSLIYTNSLHVKETALWFRMLQTLFPPCLFFFFF